MNGRPNVRAIPQQHAHILQSLREGSDHAFDAVFDMYYEPLCVYVVRIVGDSADADDIVAETLTAFWNQRKKVRFTSISQIKAYLYKTARNASLDLLGQEKRDRKMIQEASFLSAQDNIDFFAEMGIEQREQLIQEITRIVYDLIRELPQGCGEVITLFYIDQMPIKDIAFRLGICEGAVKSQKSYGVGLLRKKLISHNRDLERYCP